MDLRRISVAHARRKLEIGADQQQQQQLGRGKPSAKCVRERALKEDLGEQ